MKNLCLENYGVSRLEAQELLIVYGGSRWKLIKKIAQYVWEAAGVADAIDEFVEGWNSYECGN